MTICAYIYYNPEVGFTCHMNEIDFEITAASPEELSRKIAQSYSSNLKYCQDLGMNCDSLTYEYYYDIPTFFIRFPYFNITKVAQKIGVNPSLLRQYAACIVRPRMEQEERIMAQLKKMIEELGKVKFWG